MAKKTDILRVKLTTDGAGKVKADLLGVNQSFDRLEQGADRLGDRMRLLGKGLASAFAAVSIGKFVSETKKAIEFGDQLAKSSDKIGLAVEAFQAYSFAAERSGSTTAQFESNMTAFIKRVGEARAGVGPLTSFLKQYDEELLNNIRNTTNQDEALGLVANAIQQASTATDKAAIANAAFSRAGVGMVNMLRDGEQGLKAYTQQAIDAGAVMDASLTRKAEVLNDRWDTLTTTIGVKFKSALITAADASLNFLNIYNSLEDVLWAVVDAEERLLDAEDRLTTARGRNAAAAKRARDDAKKDLDQLREEEQRFRDIESRVERLRGLSDGQPGGDQGGGRQTEIDQMGAILDQYIAEEEAVRRAYEAKQKFIGSLRTEVDLLQYSGKELEIQTSLSEAHTRGIYDQDAAIRELVGTLYDANEAQQELAASTEDSFGEMRNAIEGWGRSFASTLLDGERDFKGFAQAIIRQLAEIAIAKSTEPLFNAFANTLASAYSGGTAATYGTTYGSQQTAMLSAQDNLFAKGGIMTKDGALPLREYADGGIVNTPQVRVAGERYQPEAIVPLPDGRAIPVQMQGGGGAVNYAPVFNIDARGADVGMLPQIRQISQQAADSAVARFKREITNGGAAARLVGRR